VNGTEPRPGESSLLRDLLFIAFKRKIFLIVMLVLGSTIVMHGIQASVPEYEATARILIKRTRQMHEMPLESKDVLRRSEVVNTELQLIMSAAVAEIVVDRLDLARGKDRGIVIGNVERRIRATSLAGSDIIDIRYRHRNAERSAQVVNAVIDAYLEVRKGVELNVQALAFLEDQAAKARTARDSVAAMLAALGAEEGTHVQGRKVGMQMDLEEDYRNRLTAIEKDIGMRERQVSVVEAWLASGGPIGDVHEDSIYNTEGVRKARSALGDLNVALADARARYTAGHPEVLAIERKIATTESVLIGEVQGSLDAQRLRLEELEAEKRAVEQVIANLRSSDRRIADAELQVKLLNHDLRVRYDLYEIVMSRMEQFRITAATDPDLTNVAVVSRAAVPRVPKPQPVNMRVVVGAFLIIFGVLMVLALEKMDQSLQIREDVHRYLGVKVLASIPDRRFHRPGR
jgi:uncharacterized protein involved in exopolysaccharide biosynthesis